MKALRALWALVEYESAISLNVAPKGPTLGPVLPCVHL